MCNDYEQHPRYAEYKAVMQELALQVASHQTEMDLPTRDDIRIGDPGPAMRAVANSTVELVSMTFGFPPREKCGPVFNFRWEGRPFADNRRCMILPPRSSSSRARHPPSTASHRRGPRSWHRRAMARRSGNHAPAFTMLTTEPGPDVAAAHNRQIVVLRREGRRHWLDLSKPEAELLRPLPEGSLDVQLVSGGSD
jgi:putative SOS response-associated peptidase YedK